ncbi:hypothetical protein SUGI_0037600 [Cryptomeria japonica]|nr:hypothetical protein SUGI_0037600 [Cryptomeria japonica]
MATRISSHSDKPVKLLCFALLFLVCFNTEKSCAQTRFKSVNLGGWLVIEGWIKPSLFQSVPNNDLMDGAQIQLKSVTLGTYVVAEDGGGQKIAVNRNSSSGWETLRIWRVKDGSYQLRVFNKQFIGAQNGGGGIVNAVATTPDTWETFQIIRNHVHPNRVHIKALNGMYMQAKSQDQLTADFQGEPARGHNAATLR